MSALFFCDIAFAFERPAYLRPWPFAEKRSRNTQAPILVSESKFLGGPFRIWTHNGFSVVHVNDHKYEYLLLTLLRIHYGFIFDEFCLDEHRDTNVPSDIAWACEVIRALDGIRSADEAARLAREACDRMRCDDWRYFLLAQGTVAHVSMSTLSSDFARIFKEDRAKFMATGRVKRVLVIENDSCWYLNQSLAEGKINKAATAIAGQDYDIILLVNTDNPEHWTGGVLEGSSAPPIFKSRARINKMWLKALSAAYGPRKCQSLLNKIANGKDPNHKDSMWGERQALPRRLIESLYPGWFLAKIAAQQI
jgi:hypothetical protein